MKRIIATVLSVIVGLFGYTVVDTAIETRVSDLENRVAYLESVVDDYHNAQPTTAVSITAIKSTTKKNIATTTKKAAPTTVPPTERYVVASGVCGKTTSWELFSDGKLVISGEGRMDGCTTESDMPVAWDEYRHLIREAEIPSGVTHIGYGAFANCINLEKIHIPDTVTELGSFVFHGCKKLRSIDLPDSIESIGAYTFAYCFSLESIVIPNKVDVLSMHLFDSCGNLKTVTFGTNIKTIDSGAFRACGVENVCYKGTEEQWNKITIVEEDNVRITLYATINYNCA